MTLPTTFGVSSGPSLLGAVPLAAVGAAEGAGAVYSGPPPPPPRAVLEAAGVDDGDMDVCVDDRVDELEDLDEDDLDDDKDDVLLVE